MYVPESGTEALEICRLPLGNTVKTPPDSEMGISAKGVSVASLSTGKAGLHYLWPGC